MKNLSYVAGLILVLIAFVFYSCSKYEAIDPDQKIELLKANAVVPFSGEYTTFPQIIGTVNGIQTVEIFSTGKAKHLGKSTWHSLATVDLNTPPPWTQLGTMEFVSANCDTLIGNYSGIAAVSGPPTPGIFFGNGFYVISEGTGRFEGYTGSGTYDFAVPPELVGEVEFEGELVKP